MIAMKKHLMSRHTIWKVFKVFPEYPHVITDKLSNAMDNIITV
jgi:hypothetical protein